MAGKKPGPPPGTVNNPQGYNQYQSAGSELASTSLQNSGVIASTIGTVLALPVAAVFQAKYGGDFLPKLQAGAAVGAELMSGSATQTRAARQAFEAKTGSTGPEYLASIMTNRPPVIHAPGGERKGK